MKFILVLTKNIAYETTLRSTIETLGYEVLCSKEALAECLVYPSRELFHLVDVIVLSETISNHTIETLVEQEVFQGKHLVRIVSTETLGDPFTSPLAGVVESSGEIEDLREVLVVPQVSLPAPSYTETNITSLIELERLLSKRERTLFQYLLDQNGTFKTREEVASYLWSDGPTSSRMAQLSQLVTKIRYKFSSIGIYNSIETNWRKGYRLSNELIDWLGKNPTS